MKIFRKTFIFQKLSFHSKKDKNVFAKKIFKND